MVLPPDRYRESCVWWEDSLTHAAAQLRTGQARSRGAWLRFSDGCRERFVRWSNSPVPLFVVRSSVNLRESCVRWDRLQTRYM